MSLQVSENKELYFKSKHSFYFFPDIKKYTFVYTPECPIIKTNKDLIFEEIVENNEMAIFLNQAVFIHLGNSFGFCVLCRRTEHILEFRCGTI